MASDSQDPELQQEAGANRLAAIMADPAYRQADQDVDYLNTDETRGIRLQLDYQKAHRQMQRHGIEQTIVVFGSTQLVEPTEAARRVEQLREALASDPDDNGLQQRLARAERVAAKSHYYEEARRFGTLVGAVDGGDHPPVTLITGGGPGIMEAANRGAYDAGAKSVGLNITLPEEQLPNSYITPGLCFGFHYFATRKLHFLLRARALVAFPGGYGTLDELFDALTLIQTEKIEPLPIILVGEAYWTRVIDIPFLTSEGMITAQDAALVRYVETADQAWAAILTWHRERGLPLI